MADPTLTPGATAPAFTLADQTGTKQKLSDHKGHKVLVYFYPRADTPGCTTQSCGLRDIASDIGDTEIIGISPDKPDKLAKFDAKYSLGFTLLAVEDHAVAEKYGVWGEKKNYGKTYMGVERSTVVIDADGTVKKVFRRVKPDDHAAQVLDVLR